MNQDEEFTLSQVIHSLKHFLALGERTPSVAHSGYCSGEGYAARCVRAHVAELEKRQSLERMADEYVRQVTEGGQDIPYIDILKKTHRETFLAGAHAALKSRTP